MKHFWLDADQQTIMDAATCNASDYGAVGLVYVDLNSQKQIRDLTGTDVAKSDQIRIYKITHNINFGRHPSGRPRWLSSAVRLTKNQAMLLKLRMNDDVNIAVAEDPTGELWGNMQIALRDRAKFSYQRDAHDHFRRFSTNSAHDCFRQLIAGNGFGATLSNVGDTCKGMPTNWARCFVWKYHVQAHCLHQPTRLKTHEVLKRAGELTPPQKMVICRDLLELPVDTEGKAAARVFTQDCQRINVRQRYLLDEELGPILD